MSQQINLFDPALQVQHDSWTARNFGFSLAAVGLVCAVWATWAHYQQSQTSAALLALEPQLKEARNAAQQLSTQIAEHQPDAALQSDLADSRVRLQARGEVLALLKKGLSPEASNQADWLRGFARQIPAGLWLTSFNINTENGALEIRGRTTNPALIPEYISRLNAEKAFQGRTFTALEIANEALAPQVTNNNLAATNPALPAVMQGAATTVQPSKPGSPVNTGRYHEFALTSAQNEATAAGGRS